MATNPKILERIEKILNIIKENFAFRVFHYGEVFKILGENDLLFYNLVYSGQLIKQEKAHFILNREIDLTPAEIYAKGVAIRADKVKQQKKSNKEVKVKVKEIIEKRSKEEVNQKQQFEDLLQVTAPPVKQKSTTPVSYSLTEDDRKLAEELVHINFLKSRGYKVFKVELKEL